MCFSELGPGSIQPRHGLSHAVFWVTPAEASILEVFLHWLIPSLLCPVICDGYPIHICILSPNCMLYSSCQSSENLVSRRAHEDSKMELGRRVLTPAYHIWIEVSQNVGEARDEKGTPSPDPL